MIPNPDSCVRNRTNFAALPQQSHHLSNLDSALGGVHPECGSKLHEPSLGPVLPVWKQVRPQTQMLPARVRPPFAAFSRK